MKAQNMNVFDTATNALVASNESALNNISFASEELSDADLMAINGGELLATPLFLIGAGVDKLVENLGTLLGSVNPSV